MGCEGGACITYAIVDLCCLRSPLRAISYSHLVILVVHLARASLLFFPVQAPLFVTRHRIWKRLANQRLVRLCSWSVLSALFWRFLTNVQSGPHSRGLQLQSGSGIQCQPTRPILWLCYSMQSDGSPLGQVRSAVAATSQTSWVCIYRRHDIRARHSTSQITVKHARSRRGLCP